MTMKSIFFFLMMLLSAKYTPAYILHGRVRLQSLRMYALKENAYNRLSEIKEELISVESKLSSEIEKEGATYQELNERKRFCKTILECFKALEEINSDLRTFEAHLDGDDDSLKKTALIYKKEFEECREQIESQLNKLL